MPAVILPIIAVATSAVFVTISKEFFRRYGRLTSREFVWLQFVGIVGVAWLAAPFFIRLPSRELIASSIPMLAGIVALAIIGNLLYYWGLEHEKISEIEPFLLFTPLITIVVAGFFYSNERIWPVYVAAVIASAVLAWAHLKRKHLAFRLGLVVILLYALTYGFEVVVTRQLLTIYDPFALYLLRSSGVLALLFLVSPPKFSWIKPHHFAVMGILGALAVASVVATYTAFQLRGVSETIFIFTLGPVLVYFLSVIFLRERWRRKNIIASIAILALVVWVSLL
jgi:drug/metabolite transporter (DMT)-like permease